MSLKGSKFRRVFPDAETLTFDGGLNNAFSRTLIPNNESPDCKNVIFDDGAVGTREGIVKLNTAAVASAAIDGLYTRRDNTGVETMLAVCNGSVFALATTTFITIPSAQGVFTAGERVAFEQAENYAFMGTSSTIAYKWNGAEFTRMGVYPPTTTATVASANLVGALTASGEYRYKITFRNSNLVESDLGPVTSTFVISTTSGQNTMAAIPVAPTSWGVGSRRIYRNAAADTSVFKLVATIADNTTTTYADNVADAALGATAPTDNGVPPKFTACIWHRNRMFVNDVSNPNYVFYSEIGQPYTFPTTNFFKIGDKTSDLVRGFSSYGDNLLIFCDESVWLNVMTNVSDDTTWQQSPTTSPYGSRSPHGLAQIRLKDNNAILFPAVEGRVFVGFSAIIGAQVDVTASLNSVSTAGSFLQSDRISPDMASINTLYINSIYSMVYKQKVYISVPYGSNQTTNNRVYCVDFSLDNLNKPQPLSWVPFTGIAINQMTIYGGNLYGGDSAATGFVHKLVGTSTYSDNGTAIDSYYWTKEFSGYEDDANYTKDFRYVNVLFDNAGAYYMRVYYRVDGSNDAGNYTQINLTAPTSLWGTLVWNVNNWSASLDQSERRVYLGTTRGRKIQFKFSNENTAGQRFKVHRINFSYNIRGYR